MTTDAKIQLQYDINKLSYCLCRLLKLSILKRKENVNILIPLNLLKARHCLFLQTFHPLMDGQLDCMMEYLRYLKINVYMILVV